MTKMALGYLVLITAILIALYKYLEGYRNRSGLPGPKRYPIVGSALQIKQDKIHEKFLQFGHQYGKMFELQLFGKTNIVLNTLEVVNKAFCGDGYKDIFNDRPTVFVGEQLSSQKGILLQNPGKIHDALRKVLVKGLHVYGDGIPQFERIVKREINKLMENIEQCDGMEFDIVSLSKASLCNVMSMLLIGDRATYTDCAMMLDLVYGVDFFGNPLLDTLFLTFPFLRLTPPFKSRFDKLMDARQRILEKMFYQTRESRKPGTIRGLVDWYLEEQDRERNAGGIHVLTDEIIHANILDLVLAGVAVTSTVLSTIVLCLTNHVGYQIKIQQELDRVIGPDREPSISDKHDCDFLVAVIMESMRYAPPLPVTMPHVCRRDVEFESYTIKANTTLIVNVWYMLHSEDVWGDPWVFRPERFLDENGKLLPNTHRNIKNWMLFGVGRRQCPGMSLANNRLFLYLAHLLKRWTLDPVPGKERPCDPKSDSYFYDVTFKPKPFTCAAKIRA